MSVKQIREENITIIQADAIVGRDGLNEFVEVLTSATTQDASQPVVAVVCDFSEANQVDWTQYARERLEMLVENQWAQQIGRIAFVLPETISKRILDMYIRRQLTQAVSKSNMSVRSFTDITRAKAWVLEAFQYETYQQRINDLLKKANYQPALPVCKTMLTLFRAQQDDVHIVMTHHQMAEVLYLIGDYDNMQAQVVASLDIASQFSDQDRVLYGRSLLLNAQYERIRYNDYKAMELAESALEIFLKYEDKHGEADTYSFMGAIYQLRYEYTNATTYFQKALVLYQLQNDSESLQQVLQQLGGINRQQGDYQAAIRFYQQALNRAIESNNRRTEIATSAMLGGTELRYGNYTDAERNLAYVVRVTESEDNRPGWVAYTYAYLAETYVYLAKFDKAEAMLAQAYEMAQVSKMPGQQGVVMRVYGILASYQQAKVAVGDAMLTPEQCFTASTRAFAEIKQDLERAFTLQAWATHAFKKNQVKQGTEMWQRAFDIFVNVGVRHEIDRMSSLPGNL